MAALGCMRPPQNHAGLLERLPKYPVPDDHGKRQYEKGPLQGAGWGIWPAASISRKNKSMHPLIQELKTRQGDKPYRAYAKELNTSTSHLFHVLERGRNAGISILSAVTVHFPDLDELVLKYLRDRYDGS